MEKLGKDYFAPYENREGAVQIKDMSITELLDFIIWIEFYCNRLGEVEATYARDIYLSKGGSIDEIDKAIRHEIKMFDDWYESTNFYPANISKQ